MSEYEFHHLGCGCGCNDYLRNPKESEIARQEKAIRKLEECNEYLMGRVLENNHLITELATYLEGKRRERYDGNAWISTLDEEGEELLKRAREAINP
jgi:hypothetical protein